MIGTRSFKTVAYIATGVAGGQSATPDSENLPTIGKNQENREKNQEKSGKKEEKSGRKGKNREVSFTLPLLTDRAGYATALRLGLRVFKFWIKIRFMC